MKSLKIKINPNLKDHQILSWLIYERNSLKNNREKNIFEKFKIYENIEELANEQFNNENFEAALNLYLTVF